MLIDSFDRQIIFELQRSCRPTNVELAARVGLSPSPCLVRVRALEEVIDLAGTMPVFLGAALILVLQAGLLLAGMPQMFDRASARDRRLQS